MVTHLEHQECLSHTWPERGRRSRFDPWVRDFVVSSPFWFKLPTSVLSFCSVSCQCNQLCIVHALIEWLNLHIQPRCVIMVALLDRRKHSIQYQPVQAGRIGSGYLSSSHANGQLLLNVELRMERIAELTSRRKYCFRGCGVAGEAALSVTFRVRIIVMWSARIHYKRKKVYKV